jgi:hypothetical protein
MLYNFIFPSTRRPWQAFFCNSSAESPASVSFPSPEFVFFHKELSSLLPKPQFNNYDFGKGGKAPASGWRASPR